MRRPDGRRHSVYGRTRAETARKLAVAIRDRDSHAPPSATMTLAAFLTRWLREDATPRLRPRTAERYALDVKRASKAILRG